MSARVTLPEPLAVDSFWRNRKHEAVVSTLSTYEGRNIFDIRIHAMKDGRLVPTQRGVTVVVLRLPDLAKAINKALKQARELGLLPADDGVRE
jgi:Transcriptional Coactivator p15 (PC4)